MIHPLPLALARSTLTQYQFPSLWSIASSLSFEACVHRGAREVNLSATSSWILVEDDGETQGVEDIKTRWGEYSEDVGGLEVHSGQVSLVKGWISNEQNKIRGSRVHIQDLFRGFPVRKQEAILSWEAKTRNNLERLALFVPKTHFTFVANDVQVWNRPACQDTMQAFTVAYGAQRAQCLMEIMLSNGVTALVSKARSDPSDPNSTLHHSTEIQFVFTNNRFDCPCEEDFKKALNAAFRKRTWRDYSQGVGTKRKYAHLMFVLRVGNGEMSPIDINATASELIERAGWNKINSVQPKSRLKTPWSFKKSKSDNDFDEFDPSPSSGSKKSTIRSLPSTSQSSIQNIKLSRDEIVDYGVTFIGQANDEFIIVRKNNDGVLLIVDQHAAHERIRYEELMESTSKLRLDDAICGGVPQDRTEDASVSVDADANSVTVNPTENELRELIRREVWIKSWGYAWEIGSGIVKVMRVPVICDTYLDANTLLEILREEEIDRMVPEPIRRVLASKACRGAIMFGTPLCDAECKDILVNLFKCRAPFQCAHGRPSIVPASLQLQ